MHARLFQKHNLESLEKKTVYDWKEQPINSGVFECLHGNDVITAKVSDHHPVIHNGVLFWNIMMQGRMRLGKESVSYNNGFGIIETDNQYMSRLAKVATVISEIIYQNPDIETIGLCEGPINLLHMKVFTQFLKKFVWMERFFTQDIFHKPSLDAYQNWGLLMLADKKYDVSKIDFDFVLHPSIFDKLANRFQLWKFTKDGKEKYFALGHFPFGGDEHVMEKTNLSKLGNIYCDLINHVLSRYTNEHFILCADFNFNPYLLKQWQDRVLDQITHNNSILLTMGEENSNQSTRKVTVDGVLLSAKEKQKYYATRPDFRLSSILTHEGGLFRSSFHKYLEKNRHENSRLQYEYDKRFGLIPY